MSLRATVPPAPAASASRVDSGRALSSAIKPAAAMAARATCVRNRCGATCIGPSFTVSSVRLDKGQDRCQNHSERTTHEGAAPCNFSVQGEVGTQRQAERRARGTTRRRHTRVCLAAVASQGESWCMTVWQDTIARPLRALHLDTTRNQILVFAVVATVIPTLATTCVSYTQNRRWLADKVTQELRSASSEAAREADLWLKERLADLRVSASSAVVSEALAKAGRGSPDRESLGRLNDYLTSVRGRFPDLETVQVLDPRGRVVTSSASRPSPVQVSLPLGLGRLRSLRPDDAFIGDPYWDAGLGKAVMVLAIPIHQADGRFFGALAAKSNLQSVADLLQRVTPGDSADVYLMTSQGSLVIKSHVSSADLMRTKVPKPTAQLLSDREGTVVAYKRADGQDVVGALQRAPQLRWAAVAETPRARSEERRVGKECRSGGAAER